MFNKMIKLFVFFMMFFPFCRETCNAMKSVEQDTLIVFIELPKEIINCILDKLDCKTLCKISVVCKTFAVDFAAHIEKIKNHRQLGTIKNGTTVLCNQVVTLPLSDMVFFNPYLPITIEGIVTIRCIDSQNHCFSLKSPCIIKSNATLRIVDGTILEFAPRDNRFEPLSTEAESGGLVVSNATLKTKTGNPEGVFLNTNLITFDGKCSLDASGGTLIFVEKIILMPAATVTVVAGQIEM